MKITRSSGILLHISSLPSPYGIGTLGKEAYAFADFLKQAGQSYWQILPIGPTSYGDSPYQSFSTFAGNPYFIDLDMLCEEGLLTKEDLAPYAIGERDLTVNYERQFSFRLNPLKKAFASFEQDSNYVAFLQENAYWLDDYALYMALKYKYDQVQWQLWDDAIRRREPQAMEAATAELWEEIAFWKFVQYQFFAQFNRLKRYCNKNGISLIGDLPIYVAMDSADVWASPEQFALDENLQPTHVAGCPPDYFSETGQLWGNPLYNWELMEKQGYDWWENRIRYAMELFDRVRIDHFRGFDSYYAIPYEAESAKDGEWRQGPGLKFFTTLQKRMGELPIIAEDLGLLTDSVRTLLAQTGYPGMKVLEFAFAAGQNSLYLPHNHIKNSIVYTGTHDNNTVGGWMSSAEHEDVRFAKQYLRLSRFEGYHWGFIRAAYQSVCDLCIVQMQDVLGLGSKARMNTPSTIGKNWQWRMKKDFLSPGLAKKLLHLTEMYHR